MSSFLAAGRAAPRVAPSFIKKGSKRNGKHQKTAKFEAFLIPGSFGIIECHPFWVGMKQWKMHGKFEGLFT